MQTSQAYISHVLQHFATKLDNFTNFDMLFPAVVKDFDFFAKMKIQFKRGMVHFKYCVFFRLGLAYAGSNREDVLSLLYPVLNDKNSTMEVLIECTLLKITYTG